MLPFACSVIDSRRSQNVVRTPVTLFVLTTFWCHLLRMGPTATLNLFVKCTVNTPSWLGALDTNPVATIWVEWEKYINTEKAEERRVLNSPDDIEKREKNSSKPPFWALRSVWNVSKAKVPTTRTLLPVWFPQYVPIVLLLSSVILR